MAKKLEKTVLQPALKWEEGITIVGKFMGVRTVPRSDSRILDFKFSALGDTVSVWENAGTKAFINSMRKGIFYRIDCKGKTEQYAGGNTGWAFDIYELSDRKEIEEDLKKYAPIMIAMNEQARKDRENDATVTDEASTDTSFF